MKYLKLNHVFFELYIFTIKNNLNFTVLIIQSRNMGQNKSFISCPLLYSFAGHNFHNQPFGASISCLLLRSFTGSRLTIDILSTIPIEVHIASFLLLRSFHNFTNNFDNSKIQLFLQFPYKAIGTGIAKGSLSLVRWYNFATSAQSLSVQSLHTLELLVKNIVVRFRCLINIRNFFLKLIRQCLNILVWV